VRSNVRTVLLAWGACVAACAVVISLSVVDNNPGTSLASSGHVSQVTEEQAQLLTSLRAQGLLPSEASTSGTDNAAPKQPDATTHDHRDLGAGPTFTQLETLPDDQLLGLFPAGSMTADDVPRFKSEIMQLRRFVQTIRTADDARAAGYFQATNDVPYMGEHWINGQYLTDGVFDPSKPEGLLFSTVDGVHQVVGVWFLQLPGVGDVSATTEPRGFTGDFDQWHAHVGLCVVGTQEAKEGESRDACLAKGGDYTADLRWMLHVWVAPEAAENSRSVVAYLNAELNDKQQATSAAAAPIAN
jgi:hypothetical protein